MSENMKKFLELVSKDEEMKKRMMDFNDMEIEKSIQASIVFAKELGIELTEDDFAQENVAGELTDEELDAVAGGGGCGCPALGAGEGPGYSCFCFAFGNGSANCVCPAVGGGTDEGY